MVWGQAARDCHQSPIVSFRRDVQLHWTGFVSSLIDSLSSSESSWHGLSVYYDEGIVARRGTESAGALFGVVCYQQLMMTRRLGAELGCALLHAVTGWGARYNRQERWGRTRQSVRSDNQQGSVGRKRARACC